MQLFFFLFFFFLELLSFCVYVCLIVTHYWKNGSVYSYLSFNSNKLMVVAKVQHADYKILSWPQT